jgi:DNA mismatch endonuclease (patch repair protein)
LKREARTAAKPTRTVWRATAKKSLEMARVRSRHTAPELAVRRLLTGGKVRYRLHVASIPGTPDIYVPRLKLAMFVNGCFWHGHGCRRSALPRKNHHAWERKIERNKNRDEHVRSLLAKEGMSFLTLWSCEEQQFAEHCKGVAEQYRNATLGSAPARDAARSRGPIAQGQRFRSALRHARTNRQT